MKINTLHLINPLHGNLEIRLIKLLVTLALNTKLIHFNKSVNYSKLSYLRREDDIDEAKRLPEIF